MSHWSVGESISDEVKSQFPGVHPVVLQLLWNRGLRTQEAMDVFLSPDWNRDTFSPSQFSNIKTAVDRVFLAFENREAITVHGDYDADGVCGSAVLVSTLREIADKLAQTAQIGFYIPHREKEGYGMSVQTMEHLHEHEKTNLVITVDCGISNKPAIDRGGELGIDTIVCDHHTMPEQLPERAILIHPLVPGETYPNKHLCGTGVAFKLASALIQEARRRGAAFPDGHEKWLLDLVAIATVTDVVPLTGENRALERFGLVVLNKTRRPGLRALVKAAGSECGGLDTTSIGFQIGPRLNAAGRMDHANAALNLLLESDEEKARLLASALQRLNIARQEASSAMYQEAKVLADAQTPQKLLIVVKDGWSAGLVGLVASKLVNEYHRPVLVVGKDGQTYVGSGRSMGGFDITKALHATEGNLDKFGGHPQACGFSTHGDDRFAKAAALMTAFADQTISDETLDPTVCVDALANVEDFAWSLFEALERFAPFGEGNRLPVFGLRGVLVAAFSTVGAEGKHLRLTVRSKHGKMCKMIGWRFGAWALKLKLGDAVHVAFTLQVNEWNGARELQGSIVDLYA